MIGFEATHDGLLAAVIVAAISGVTSVIVTTLNRKDASARFGHINEQMDTGNGHSVGAAVARIEAQQAEIINRLDRVELRQQEIDKGD